MGTPTLQGNSATSGSIIAGYFPSGEDAHRAINALLDEGFLPSQIGAAFHSSGEGASERSRESREVLGGDTMRQEIGTTITTESGSDNTMGGPGSDDSAVQPAGIATGTGSPFLGVGRPGPISGSDLSHTGLPSELKHELPSSSEGGSIGSRAGTSGTSITGGSSAVDAYGTSGSVTPTPHVGSGPQHHLHHHELHTDHSWGAKLKHLFTPGEHTGSISSTGTTRTGATAAGVSGTTAESQNFGSGEGRLGIAPPYGRPFVASEFERSVSGAGVAPEHSQHLSRRLSGGGAVVTVSATGRALEIEKIFERHHGHVRFASGGLEDAPATSSNAHVEVFGHLEHIYPTSHQ